MHAHSLTWLAVTLNGTKPSLVTPVLVLKMSAVKRINNIGFGQDEIMLSWQNSNTQVKEGEENVTILDSKNKHYCTPYLRRTPYLH